MGCPVAPQDVGWREQIDVVLFRWYEHALLAELGERSLNGGSVVGRRLSLSPELLNGRPEKTDMGALLDAFADGMRSSQQLAPLREPGAERLGQRHRRDGWGAGGGGEEWR